MHRDLKIHRRRTLDSGLLLTAGKFLFFHAVLCQWLIRYICESRDRPRVRACLFRGCRVLHTYSPTPQHTSSSIIPRGPKTDSKFRAGYLERSSRDADDIRDFLFCCSALDQIGDLANVLRCEFCPFHHGACPLPFPLAHSIVHQHLARGTTEGMLETYSIPAPCFRDLAHLDASFTSRPRRLNLVAAAAQRINSTNCATSQPSTAIHAIDATSPSPITAKGQVLPGRVLSDALEPCGITRRIAYCTRPEGLSASQENND